MTYRSIIPAICLLLSACGNGSSQKDTMPAWLEPDSAYAMHARMLADFSLSFDEGASRIIEQHPELTIDSIRALAQDKYVETMTIDGEERMFRKSPRNLNLLHPAYNGGWKHRGYDASEQRIAFVDSILQWCDGAMPDGGAHRVAIRFSIDVPYHPVLQGDTLRVWMPFPLETERQNDVQLVSTSHTDYIISTPDQSQHSTIYFEQSVDDGQESMHFEYVAEFTAKGKYAAPKDILKNLKPYDKESEEYKKYTSFDNQHIIRLDSLARIIVGEETNPFKQSELAYDYIINHYPWAGAREYSTIACLPQYVIDAGHGDCGQVTLLYISLMRTLGIPSRWESGWMLHPGEKNLHDWAETYYEGIGWVPVDVSFGRYTTSDNPAVTNFYSTGIDSHRLIANKTIGEAFYPAKRFVRSETVDSQMGEVECSKGNIFYPAWDQHLEIIKSTPL